jgi:hypothetical protein
MSRPISHFYLDKYARDLNFKKHYIEETAFAIARMKGIPIEKAITLVENNINNNSNTVDPRIKYIGKNEVGDRVRQTSTMSTYLKTAAMEGNILTGTLVQVASHKERPGIIPRIITKRKLKRKQAKREMFQAMEAGDEKRVEMKNAEQNNLKRPLNALSGASCSSFNIFYLASAHPVLTSTGRVLTSTANSFNERFLAGNRPYYTVDHVLEDIAHVCCKLDRNDVQAAINQYHLHIPSVDEVMKMIKESTSLYWDSDVYMAKIHKLVSGLEDIERAMVMYSGDLYNLTIYNDKAMRDFFGQVINIDRDYNYPDKEPLTMGKDGAIELFAKSTMIDTLKDIDFSVIKEETPEVYQKLCNTYHAIDKMMSDNKILINAFWVNRVLPRDIGHFPTSYRKVDLLSDTDSVVFTAQFFLDWYLGKDYEFNEKVWSIVSLITYLVSCIIQHFLAQISTNIGADEEHRYILSMKSEFLFGILGLTGRGKHYYSNSMLQEGKVPNASKAWEIKGSALVASKVSSKVTDRAHNMLQTVITKKLNNEPVYAADVLDDVVNLEQEIERSVLAGEVDYLRMESIRPKEDYTSENPHQYFNYEFWQYVYGGTYGSIEYLPYDGVRLPLTITTKSRLTEWINSIDDPVIKERIDTFLKQKGKTKLPSIVLPLNNITSIGIPKAFHSIINIKLLIANLVSSYYLLLDSFGLYITRNNNGKNIITIRDRMAMSVDEFKESGKPIYIQED